MARRLHRSMYEREGIVFPQISVTHYPKNEYHNKKEWKVFEQLGPWDDSLTESQAKETEGYHGTFNNKEDAYKKARELMAKYPGKWHDEGKRQDDMVKRALKKSMLKA